MKKSLFLAAAAGFAVANAAVAQQIISIGLLPSGNQSQVLGISADGMAAACAANAPEGPNMNFRAARWTPGGGLIDIGFPSGGQPYAQTTAISSNGLTMAGTYINFLGTQDFRWTTAGGFQTIPHLSGANNGFATGLSADGSIVVGWSFGGSLPFYGRATKWNGAGTPTNLGLLPGRLWSEATAISANGNVVVGFCGDNLANSNNTEPFRYVGGGPMQSLGVMAGQVYNVATAASADGSVIAGYSNFNAPRGFRWTAATGVVDLSNAGVPGAISGLRTTYGITGDGNAIVGQGFFSPINFGNAVIWTPLTGTQDLKQHLTLRGVNTSTWTLGAARCVNSTGTAFGGTGFFGGQSVGWVANGLGCPTITQHPTGVIQQCPNTTIVLTVAATGVGNLYRWQLGGTILADGFQPSGSFISGANTPTLNIFGTQPGDSGTYRANVSAQGVCPVLSNASSVTVLAGPSVNNQPQDETICNGQNVALTSGGSPGFPGLLTFRWQKRVPPTASVFADIFDGPTGNGSTYAGTDTTLLSINNAAVADSDEYRMVVTDGCGSQDVSQVAFITVLPNTTIVTQPAPTSVCAGDNDAFFSVVASPAGYLTYQWQKFTPCPFINCFIDIFDGPTGNGGNYGGTQTANLTIAGCYGADFDRYRCLVTGPCGSAQTTIDVLLSAVPDATVVSGPDPTGGCYGPGGTASFTVTTTPGGCTYHWQVYFGPCILCWNNLFDGPTGNGGTYSGAQSPTLTINGLFSQDYNVYRCIVTGPCGTNPLGSPGALLSPLDPPTIDVQPAGSLVCPNGTGSLFATLGVGNLGNVTYQWWRYINIFPIFAPIPNGPTGTGSIASGAQTTILSISNFQQADTGQYYLWVTGECGTVLSSVVDLTWCVVDFNCSGTLGSQDIFDFLAAYFINDPSADFNNSNSITVQDIFDFLAAFFAGCP